MKSNKTKKKHSLPKNFWFLDENQNEVHLLATVGEWCMVTHAGKKKPYVLPKDFLLELAEQ